MVATLSTRRTGSVCMCGSTDAPILETGQLASKITRESTSSRTGKFVEASTRATPARSGKISLPLSKESIRRNLQRQCELLLGSILRLKRLSENLRLFRRLSRSSSRDTKRRRSKSLRFNKSLRSKLKSMNTSRRLYLMPELSVQQLSKSLRKEEQLGKILRLL